jgi:hypothetical protein
MFSLNFTIPAALMALYPFKQNGAKWSVKCITSVCFLCGDFQICIYHFSLHLLTNTCVHVCSASMEADYAIRTKV